MTCPRVCSCRLHSVALKCGMTAHSFGIYQGEEDPFVPMDYARHLAKNLPVAELTPMPGLGHLYPLCRDFQDQLFQRLTLQLDRHQTKESQTPS